jgi:hypothetical protein
MSLLNDSPEVFDLDSGVDSGGVDRLVSEKLLDVPQLRALLQQMSGEGVPQRVRVHPVRNARLLPITSEHPVDRARGEPRPHLRQEEGLLALLVKEARTSFPKVDIHRLSALSRNRKKPILLPLAVPNPELLSRKIDVAHVQVDTFP